MHRVLFLFCVCSVLLVICAGCKFQGSSPPVDPSGGVAEAAPDYASSGAAFSSPEEERGLSLDEVADLQRRVKEYQDQIKDLENKPPQVVEKVVEKPVADPMVQQALNDATAREEEFKRDIEQLKKELEGFKEERKDATLGDASQGSAPNPPLTGSPTPPHDAAVIQSAPVAGEVTDDFAAPVFTANPDSFSSLMKKGWNIEMITSDHCIHCNEEEIAKGAESSGFAPFVSIVKVNDDQTLAKYGVSSTPSYLFKFGEQVIDRKSGRMSWNAVRDRYYEVARKGIPLSTSKVMQAQPMQAIPLGSINIKQQVEKAIETLRPMLEGGATLSFSYAKQGAKSVVVKPFGVPVTLGADTKLTIGMQGDDILVGIAPPVYATLGGFPLPGVKGLKLNPDGTTVDLKWLPSFVEPKVIFK